MIIYSLVQLWVHHRHAALRVIHFWRILIRTAGDTYWVQPYVYFRPGVLQVQLLVGLGWVHLL